MSDDFYNVGDMIIPKEDYRVPYITRGRLYKVTFSPQDEIPSIVDDDGDYLNAHVENFYLAHTSSPVFTHTTNTSGDFSVIQPEISVSRSETFTVVLRGQTHTLTREQAQKLSDELLSSLNEPFQIAEQADKSVPTEEVVIKHKLPFEVSDRYPELPEQIVEFRNEFGDFLVKRDLLDKYVSYSCNNDDSLDSEGYIDSAFDWYDTKEGLYFWGDTNMNWRDVVKRLRSEQEGE